VHASVTRGNYYRLVPQRCRYDLRKYYFTNRVVPVWNSLPNEVVMADNINIFKNRLDKFWASHDFVYLFRAQPLEPEELHNFSQSLFAFLYFIF